MALSKFTLPIPFDDQPIASASRGFAGQMNTGYRFAALADLCRKEASAHVAQDQSLAGQNSIPSPTAHISYYDTALKNAKNSDRREEVFNLWLGILVVVGLSRRKGYRLTLEPMKFSSSDFTVTQAYSSSLLTDGRIINNDTLFLLCKDGAPIATLDQELMLAPFTYIDPRVMKDVPWYIPEDTQNRKMARCSFSDADGKSLLSNKDRAALLWWFDTVFAIAPPAIKTLASKVAALLSTGLGGKVAPAQFQSKPAPLSDLLLPVQQSIDNLPNSRYNYLTALFTPPAFSIQLPTEADTFSDKLLLVPGGKLGDPFNGSYLRIRLEQNRKQYIYGTLLPFRPSFCKLLHDHRDMIRVSSLTANTDLFTEADGYKIRIQLKLNVDGDERVYEHTYAADTDPDRSTVLQSSGFLHSSLWPNVYAIPSGQDHNVWNRYYITLANYSNAGIAVPLTREYPKLPMVPKLDLKELELQDWMADGAAVSMLRAEDTMHNVNQDPSVISWSRARFRYFPEFVCFGRVGRGRVLQSFGSVYLRQPEVIELQSNSPMQIAIDLGTTNTVCLAQQNGTIDEQPLLFSTEDVRDFAPIFQSLGTKDEKPLQTILDDATRLYRYYLYANTNDTITQLATVAQLFDLKSLPSNHELRELEDGRALPRDAHVISHFLLQSELASKSKQATSAARLYSNIKLTNQISDPSNPFYKALTIFLRNLALQMLLYAVRKRASSVSFLFSYPDESCKANLRPIWEDCLHELVERTDEQILPPTAGQQLINYPENVAASIYVRNMKDGPDGKSGYTIADIGGGTLDVSVWRKLTEEEKERLKAAAAQNVPMAGRGRYGRAATSVKAPTQHNDVSLLQTGSVRFAGNLVLAQSLYQCARSMDLNAFKTMWNAADLEGERSATFEELYQRLTDITVLSDQASAWESALEEKALITNTLVREYGFKTGKNWDRIVAGLPEEKLRTLVRTRMACIFYLVASFIRTADGMHLNVTDADGNLINIGQQYRVQMAGGGSRILNLCGSSFLNDTVKLNLAYENGYRPEDGFDYENTIHIEKPLANDKIEVAYGMLKGGNAGTNYSQFLTLEKVSSSDRVSDYAAALCDAYSSLIEWLGEPPDVEPCNYCFTTNGIRYCVSDDLAMEGAHKAKILLQLNRNFDKVIEMDLTKAMVPYVVAVYTLDDMLNELY